MIQAVLLIDDQLAPRSPARQSGRALKDRRPPNEDEPERARCWWLEESGLRLDEVQEIARLVRS